MESLKDKNIGWIPYLNLFPLKEELTRILSPDHELMHGPPSQVNRWLMEGTVALAPCSSINLLKSPAVRMFLPIGVASDGPVLSVYLGYQRGAEELVEWIKKRTAWLGSMFAPIFSYENRRVTDCHRASQKFWAETAAQEETIAPPSINFTPASASSTLLTKILYRLWFGDKAFQQQQMLGWSAKAPWSLELLIGDEALVKRNHFAGVLDLGQMWSEMTGLPFVFAVWQTLNIPQVQHLIPLFVSAIEIASARMKVDPSSYLTRLRWNDQQLHEDDIKRYWKLIQYRLTPQHLTGLAFYFSFARLLNGECAPGVNLDEILVKILRLEETFAYG